MEKKKEKRKTRKNVMEMKLQEVQKKLYISQANI